MNFIKRVTVASCVVLLLSLPSGRAQTPTSIDFRKFSGVWNGTMTMVERGSCRMMSGSLADYPYRLRLTANEDGSFVAEPLLARRMKQKQEALTWTGTIQRDLSVTVTAPVNAECGGRNQKIQVTYKGRLFQRKGTNRLDLQGTDTACGEIGCTFERIFELQQK